MHSPVPSKWMELSQVGIDNSLNTYMTLKLSLSWNLVTLCTDVDEEQAAPPPPAVELAGVLEMQDEPVSVPRGRRCAGASRSGCSLGAGRVWAHGAVYGRMTSSSAPRCSLLLCSPHGLSVDFYLPLALCIPCWLCPDFTLCSFDTCLLPLLSVWILNPGLTAELWWLH